MLKKGFNIGVIYILIAVLFAVGAISKTISDNSTVIALQWLCVFAFALLGVWQLRKK